MKKIWVFVINIAVALGVGGLSSLVSGGMSSFERIPKPALAPPPWVFPVVWSILYILMGIGIALVLVSDANAKEKGTSLKLYIAQLFFNFVWGIWFFNLNYFGLAFIWLLALLVLIILMTVSFSKASKTAAYLQIPYILWVAFAGYLNLMIYFMAR